jgi:hypothetical protein
MVRWATAGLAAGRSVEERVSPEPACLECYPDLSSAAGDPRGDVEQLMRSRARSPSRSAVWVQVHRLSASSTSCSQVWLRSKSLQARLVSQRLEHADAVGAARGRGGAAPASPERDDFPTIVWPVRLARISTRRRR